MCCDGYKCMLCWILAYYDVDAVHFLKVLKVQSNTQVCLLKRAWAFYKKPRKVSMFGIVNWASTRENLGGGGGGCEHQGADQPVHWQTFAIRLLENIVSRLASIKYTHLFPITVVSSMIDYIFLSCAGSCYLIYKVLEKTNIVLNYPLQKKQQPTRK